MTKKLAKYATLLILESKWTLGLACSVPGHPGGKLFTPLAMASPTPKQRILVNNFFFHRLAGVCRHVGALFFILHQTSERGTTQPALLSVRFQSLLTFNEQQYYFVFPGLFLGYSRAMNIYTPCACVVSCIYNSFS